MALSLYIVRTSFLYYLFTLLALKYFFCNHTAYDDYKKFPVPTPENDWKGFKRDWPDDGYGLGDYPNLPDISYQRRQHKGWWDWQDRRNFNEPV